MTVELSTLGSVIVTAAENEGYSTNLGTFTVPASTTVSAFGATLVDDADASTARTTLGVDAAGTDNSTDVTLVYGTSPGLDYVTLSGQALTVNAVDLAADVTGNLPVANLNSGTSASGTTFWRGDGTWATPAGSGDALVANGLDQFAATTSLELKGVISDETGSGALVFATSPTLVTPALGTPSALVGTNITGTASGLTAGNVTTNANLTGHVTSVGNAAVLGSFTVAQLNTAISDATLSGNNTGDQTNITGNAATVTTNANLTGHVTSTGNAAVLGSFTFAQLNTAVSDATLVSTTTNKPTECISIAVSDETTDLTTGIAKGTFRMPYAFTLTAVRCSVTTAPTGSTLIVDINENVGSSPEVVSILSTKLTIDAAEKTSTTAATAAVISDSALADDAEITIDIDQIGSSVAGAGLKVYLIGTAA